MIVSWWVLTTQVLRDDECYLRITGRLV